MFGIRENIEIFTELLISEEFRLYQFIDKFNEMQIY